MGSGGTEVTEVPSHGRCRRTAAARRGGDDGAAVFGRDVSRPSSRLRRIKTRPGYLRHGGGKQNSQEEV